MTLRLPAPAVLGAFAVSLCGSLGVSGCAATTGGTATPAAAIPAATAQSLPALLLSAADVSGALGGEVVAAREVSEPWNDTITVQALSEADRDAGCLPIAGAAQRSVYEGTGWIALRGQTLREPPAAPGWSHFASQAVALFATPASASDFYARSVRTWSGCADRDVAFDQQPAPAQVWSIGPITADAEVLTVSRTQRSPMQWFCQRALSVRGAVVIDLEACSADGPTSAAAAMSRVIGERLPTP